MLRRTYEHDCPVWAQDLQVTDQLLELGDVGVERAGTPAGVGGGQDGLHQTPIGGEALGKSRDVRNREKPVEQAADEDQGVGAHRIPRCRYQERWLELEGYELGGL